MYRRRVFATVLTLFALTASLPALASASEKGGRGLFLKESPSLGSEGAQLAAATAASRAPSLPLDLTSLPPSPSSLADAETAMVGCNNTPASPAIGAAVPRNYFGVPGPTVNPSLVGQVQLLTSGPLDVEEGTITLPLYRGETLNHRNVWYIVTDTTDLVNAEALGLNHSAKLNYADVGRGVHRATLGVDGLVTFTGGAVNFALDRQVVPGSESSPFPPAVANPGAAGARDYSPLAKIVNAGNHVYNMPVIAFNVSADEINFPDGNPDYSKVHDKVVRIDPFGGTVTLRLTPGFSFGRAVLYLSTEASQRDVAALEGNTYAPGLEDVPTGGDDGLFSGVERIFVFANGARGCDNPHRQGLGAAIADGATPFNVLGGIPTIATDYSPLWDVNLGEWTQEAIDAGYRARLIDEFQILSFADNGFLTGPGGAPYGSVGAIVNCPIVFRFL